MGRRWNIRRRRWWLVAEVIEDIAADDPVNAGTVVIARRRFLTGRKPARAESRAVDWIMEEMC